MIQYGRTQFQFTCPSRSTTVLRVLVLSPMSVSIHVPLAEHDIRAPTNAVGSVVSIHVPLAEHDSSAALSDSDIGVSIHVPLAEHDKLSEMKPKPAASFNSRAPRGARRCTRAPRW